MVADSYSQFTRGGADFTVELLDKLNNTSGKESILISPFSIQTCMALAFCGAKGDTASEIVTAMKYNSSCADEVAKMFEGVLEKYKDNDLLKIANKLYVQEGTPIKADYAAVTKQQYRAAAESVDFAKSSTAAQTINTWVENKTGGKITDLISPDSLDADTRLVLLNALHFKGEWQEKFDETATEESDFWVAEGKSVKVHFMRQKTEFKLGFFDELQCSALEMPYKDSDLSMFIMLPQEHDGLNKLAEKLKTVNLLDLHGQMRTTDVIVGFPKFKIDYSIEMTDVLKEMGVQKAFTADADFSNILEPAENLYLSKVLHKTSIEVNEEGAEAAAATAMKISLYCMPPQFVADHPFFYWIWNGKNILFAGAFVNPPAIE